MSTIDLNKITRANTRKSTDKAFAAARAVSDAQATRIAATARLGVRSWATLAKAGGITIPSEWLARSPDMLTVTQFCDYWKRSSDDRYLAARTSAEAAVVEVEHVKQKFEHVTLKPQQRKAVDGIVSAFKSDTVNGCLLPLKTGKGKSFICGAVINWFKDNNFLGVTDPLEFFPPVLYITPRTVVEKTKRTLREKFGLKVGNDATDDVMVIHYQALSTKRFKVFFEQYEEDTYNQKRMAFRWRASPFALVIVDESHKIKKETSVMTRRIAAMAKGRGGDKTKWLFTSATPGVTLNDMKTFSILAGVRFAGDPINHETWTPYIRQFSGDPHKPNSAAMLRWAKSLGAAYVNPPDDPSKTKTINRITLLSWENEEQRRKYLSAEEDYIKALERAGGSTAISDRGAMARATMIFRAAEELIKAESMVKRALDLHARGYAPVIADAFLQSVIETLALLAKAGIPRSKISVIWGGKRLIKQSEIFTEEEYVKAVDEYVDENFNIEDWDREKRAKFRKSREYYGAQVRGNYTSSEYADRVEWLEQMGLKHQTDEERQREIDRFQSGETEFCIFTLAAGGVGVDLDQQLPHVRPRWMLATICYYAEEYQQALGRCKRIATLQPEVVQESLFFEDSIAARHVAPKLGGKLASINALASTGIDFSLMLEQAVLRKERGEPVQPMSVESDEDVNDPEGDDEEDDDEDNNDNDNK